MSITRWNAPTTRDLFGLMRDMMEAIDMDGGRANVARLPLDAYATENEIVVTAAVPGVKPEDVEITVEGDTLTIRGEIPGRIENVSYVFSEQFHGPFSRTLQLNVPVDQDRIEAQFENGVLTLTLPKAEAIRPKVIKVTAK
ncbi:MAG: Hsp20/alpha crystallin family protein [Anaerolineae bacterium]|nr:Hsp20/alpha crystallin family protein [Anaerolineae bacterium]